LWASGDLFHKHETFQKTLDKYVDRNSAVNRKGAKNMKLSILDGKKILAVDDEPDVLNVIEEEIAGACRDCKIETATTYETAAQKLASESYDLVVLDIMGVRGFDLLELAVSRHMKVVMLTAHALNPNALTRAFHLKARAYLPKDKLGEIVPFLEDVLTHEFLPGWKVLLKKLGDLFETWKEQSGYNRYLEIRKEINSSRLRRG
jgi:CheY-like chemotaxis protein